MIRPCNLVNFPDLIKQLRIAKKISQKKLGNRVGVTDKAISSYEKGTIKPSVDVFFRILYVCGYSLELKEDIYKSAKDLTIPLSQA